MHANFCALFRGDSWQSSGVIDRLAGMQATPKQLFRYCAHAMQGYRYRSISVLRAKPVYLVGNLIGVKKSKKYVFASAPAQAACHTKAMSMSSSATRATQSPAAPASPNHATRANPVP